MIIFATISHANPEIRNCLCIHLDIIAKGLAILNKYLLGLYIFENMKLITYYLFKGLQNLCAHYHIGLSDLMIITTQKS